MIGSDQVSNELRTCGGVTHANLRSHLMLMLSIILDKTGLRIRMEAAGEFVCHVATAGTNLSCDLICNAVIRVTEAT